MQRWLDEGTKVKHKLTGWEGYVVCGKESRFSWAGDVSFNMVNFYNPDKNEIVRHDVVTSELIILEE